MACFGVPYFLEVFDLHFEVDEFIECLNFQDFLECVGFRKFYECLKYQGCGTQASYWLDDVEGTISLDIKGVSRGTGYITITYESKRWSDILDRFNNENNSADEESL